SYQVASRDHHTEAGSSARVSDQTGLALLRAFGRPDDEAGRSLVTSLVAVLIRGSFYAEQVPRGLSRRPLVEGTAQLFHRVLVGPIEGVNVVRTGRSRRRRLAVPVPEAPLEGHDLRPRGERT